VIIVLNSALGYVREARAEQAIAALQRMAAAIASVMREARGERVSSADLVPGDILVLAEGDPVGADAPLLEAASLTVAEASLTGASEAVLNESLRSTDSRGWRPGEHGVQRYCRDARPGRGNCDRHRYGNRDGQHRKSVELHGSVHFARKLANSPPYCGEAHMASDEAHVHVVDIDRPGHSSSFL